MDKITQNFSTKEIYISWAGGSQEGAWCPLLYQGACAAEGGGRGDWVRELVAFKSIVLNPKN